MIEEIKDIIPPPKEPTAEELKKKIEQKKVGLSKLMVRNA